MRGLKAGLIALALLGCNREPLTDEQQDAVAGIAEATVQDNRKVRELEERIEVLEDRIDRSNIPE